MATSLSEAQFFETSSPEKIWQRYCGFLDLSLQQFMEIQRYLLMQQMDRVAGTPVGAAIMNGHRPTSVSDFRRLTPITRYEDYSPYLDGCRPEPLGGEPSFWCHSAGRGGHFKWVPYTQAAFDRVARYVIAIGILAAADKKGEVLLSPKPRVLVNLAPRPYASGSLLYHFARYFPYQPIPPLAEAESLEFDKRTQLALKLALETGVDYVFSAGSVLTKIGESLNRRKQKLTAGAILGQPRSSLRMALGWLRSKLEHRQLLPRDLWTPRGLITFGVDTPIHEKEIAWYWGKTPFQVYGTTEIMIGAMQAWNKKGLTFLPDLAFWEFIPESEWQQYRSDPGYQPATVLMDELLPGNRYELVLTHLHGMPLLRYCIGDVFKVTALEDSETGVRLPQLVFQSRANDIIDLAGLTQIDESTLSQAMGNAGIRYEDWCARKEYKYNYPYLHVFLEPKEACPSEEAESLLETELRAVDADFRDMDAWLGQKRTVKVTFLSPGTYARYLEGQLREHAPLGQLRPARINPPETQIVRLLHLSNNGGSGQ